MFGIRKFAMCFRQLFSSRIALALCVEFLGTFILVAVGNASVAQSQLTNGKKGDFFTTNWGWALGVMLGLLVSIKISGGHLNPAISFALALFRKFPWKKMMLYWIAQYLGALVASAIVLGIYHEAIRQGKVDGEFRIHKNHSDPGTAAIFANYPAVTYPSVLTGLVEEVLATTIFVLVICVVTDKSLSNISQSMQPLYIGFTLLAMGIAYGSSGYALNPARDLSPRLVTLFGGWGPYVFSFRGYNWFWIFIVGPHIGAILGVGVFQVLSILFKLAQDPEMTGGIQAIEDVTTLSRISQNDSGANLTEKYVHFNENAL